MVDPAENQAKLFVPAALRFGRTAAVYAFIVFSRTFSFLLAKLLKITVVDFSKTSPTGASPNI